MKNVCKMVVVFLLCTGMALVELPSAVAQEDEFILEEVTVTAEKREVNVQDTAISITAITGADIRDKGEASVSSLLESIAAVQVQGFQEGNQVFIRGIGSNVDADMADPSTALMVDGVYSSRAESTMGSLYDISRVEVLRGPQGTLYGRNAIGGTVNMVSNAPSDKFESTGTFQVGDYNLKHFDGALNFPISDTLAGRVAVLRETRDGYLSDGGVFVDKFSYRAKVSYTPSEKLDVLATFERTEDNGNQQGTVPVPGSAGNLPAMGWADGFDYEAGWVAPIGGDAWSNWILKDYRKDIEYEISLDEGGGPGKHTRRADTLEGLAKKIEVDPNTFVKTIETYNQYCDSKRDLDFYKNAKSLIPLRNPPYYAFFTQRFVETTHGGIVTNEKMEVYKDQAKTQTVRGLFAAGDTSGGWITDYTGMPPISAGTYMVSSGYLAGQAAGEYLLRA